MTVPFGSMTRWPNDGPFKTATTFNTLPLLDIKPTLAYKVTENLSLGLGADIYTFSGLIGEGQLEKHSVSSAGVKTELAGKDTAAGFNASLLYTALRNSDGKPLANIGLVYRSQATLHLTGALLNNGAKVSDASSTFVLPQIITGAIAIWPVRTSEREWKLELDVDHVGWKSVRDLDVRLGTGATIAKPQNWTNTYAVMVGTEYKWLALESLPHWDVALRAGYTNQQNQMPDLTYDPGLPSSDLHIVGGRRGITVQGAGIVAGADALRRSRCGLA